MIFLLLLAGLAAGQSKPNIVLILADDLGFNDVSWHNPIVLTPNLEDLARKGVILEDHYSQSTCSPTRGALLTGRYAANLGLNAGAYTPLTPEGLPTNITTVADRLRSAGYSTYAVGKWHLGVCNKAYWPTSRGFDVFSGFLGGTTDYFTHRTDGACHINMAGYDYRANEDVDFDESQTYDTYLTRDKAIEIIKNQESEKPMFLYLPFHAPHDPFQVEKHYQDLYSDIPDENRQIYLGMVTALDDAVGEIVNTLKETGLYDNTIIAFLSDNGGPGNNWPPTLGTYEMEFGSSNWPLRGSKLTLFEGGTRTVSFIHYPKSLTPREETGMFHVSDWFPTLLSAAGLEKEEGLDGVDHWARLTDSSAPHAREEMLYNMFLPIDTLNLGIWGDIDAWPPIAALRVGDYKYIWRQYGFAGWGVPAEQGGDEESEPSEVLHQLFNLKTDPMEMENLVDSEPEIAAAMFQRLEEIYEELGPAANYTLPPPEPSGNPALHGEIWEDGWC